MPLGTHSALGGVSQHRVVTAMRACEVAADATNALALEAAVRRSGAGEGKKGRGYYRDLCFKIHALAGGELEEFGEGGFTDWGMRLAASGKERLLISGLGIDRLALALQPPGPEH